MQFIRRADLALPKRKKDSRKGDNGRILLIGGSEAYPGAAALAGIAALRSGADWVTIAAPEKSAWAINSLSADLVSSKLKGRLCSTENIKKIKELIARHDTILVGNGLGTGEQEKKLAKESISQATSQEKQLVLDADAIKLSSIQELKESIITPHIKELETFLQNSGIQKKTIASIITEKDIEKRARQIQALIDRDLTILLKGSIDTIISRKLIRFNKTGNPGMAKAGTGDVLAGLCAGMYAQCKDPILAASSAAYINGLAGDSLRKKKDGFYFLASDLSLEISRLQTP